MLKLKPVFCMALLSLACANIADAQQKSLVETAVGAGKFNTLVTAVKAAGLVEALSGPGQLTVFAPTDEAFSKLDPALLKSLLLPENKAKLAAVLSYHVVPGRVSAQAAYGLASADSLGGQRLNLKLNGDVPMVNDASLVATDIGCTNGVIHVIDKVLIPALDTIPETAVKAGTFNTLVAAVGAAGLGEVLSGQGPLTVFAPTDDAFAKLPAGTVEMLLKPENKQKLIDILKYHVVAGRVYDDQAVKSGRATTLLGRSLKIGFSAAGIKVNDSLVVAKNIDAVNGLVHVIDEVLLPSGGVTPTEALATLKNAIERGAPVFNSGDSKQCADIYAATLTELMESGIEGIDDHSMERVKHSLASAASSAHSDHDRAWALRSTVDQLFNRLGRMPVQTFTSQQPMTTTIPVIEPILEPTLIGPATN